ncbi:MAG: pilus assembly protein TadG-related protein [Cohaesibacteraceae bacterium]
MSILREWSKKLRACTSDQRGAVAVIFGIVVIPVVGLVGASLDYSRAANVQTQLQGALDAALLSSARLTSLSDEELEDEIRAQVLAMVDGAHGADALGLDISRDNETDLLDIRASMDIDTTLLAIMGIDDITVGADAAVGTEIADMEVALVLDNTGSMRHSDRIGSLREAALVFVEGVSVDGASDILRISVVPYTAQANIGNSTVMEQYLDKDGLSEFHASFIEDYPIARRDTYSCQWATASVDRPAPEVDFADVDAPSGLTSVPGFSQFSFLNAYADAFGEVFGVQAAQASSVTPYEFVLDPDDDCFIRNPSQISHWQLYQQLDGVDWKGCVEARPEPFDATDEFPDPNLPNTLWVPAFWLDDEDGSWRSSNNWLSDRENQLEYDGDDFDFYGHGETYSIYKYVSSSGNSVDEVPSTTRGPAQNCGDPILPLTDNFTVVNETIDSMTYWSSGGTVTAQGVVWGWRALSPTQPFTEGAAYGEATKVMVVMTDGRNELVSSYNSGLYSHYSGYGYAAGDRLPGSSISSSLNYINQRTEAACTNAKAAGSIVYTVTFGLDSSSRAMWDRCATETEMAHHVNSASDLIGAFNEIADSIGELRLTR